MFLFFLACFVASCIKPPYVDFLLMQHVPTFMAAVALAYVSNRFVISRLSFAAIILFLCLHTLGAHYLYSYVPYDAWSEQLFGVDVTRARLASRATITTVWSTSLSGCCWQCQSRNSSTVPAVVDRGLVGTGRGMRRRC